MNGYDSVILCKPALHSGKGLHQVTRVLQRIFERVRSVFALPTRMTGKSSMSKESTRDAQVAGYHL